MTASKARQQRLERHKDYYRMNAARWREYARKYRERKAAELGRPIGGRRGRPPQEPEDITVCLYCTRTFCDGSYRCYRMQRIRRDCERADAERITRGGTA